MSTLAQYQGKGQRPGKPPHPEWPSHPDRYRADDKLVKAVNVALLLRRPLLLTGEPGTGKTELAYSVAWELGLDEPLRFDTRSTSESRHLFYTYDALGRFQAAHGADAGEASARRWVQFQALGLAILGTLTAEEAARVGVKNGITTPRRSVVLVDEIDKAPRDFPNDLLAAIDQMYFTVTELDGLRIAASEALRPVVIVTSNSERALPDAFLRRCVYHHVEFPDEARLREIVDIRLPGTDDKALVDDALRVFQTLRASGMNKIPATAEFLDWLRALDRLKGEHGGKLTPELALATIGVLVKRNDDRDTATRAIESAFDDVAPARRTALG